MAAGYCPAKKLALTEGVGVRLDGFQNLKPCQFFGDQFTF
jgi:hypothetical protein